MDSELNNVVGALPMLPIEEEKSPELKEIESVEEKKDFAKAALVDHPGWKQIAEQMRSDIERIKGLREVDMKQYTDKELGEVVRGEFRVAAKLEEYLNSVEEAVNAVGIYNERRKQGN